MTVRLRGREWLTWDDVLAMAEHRGVEHLLASKVLMTRRVDDGGLRLWLASDVEAALDDWVHECARETERALGK